MADTSKYERHAQEPFAACEDPNVPYAKWMLEKLAAWRPTRILDVGCGTGVHTKWFNQNVAPCVGITINPAELERRVDPAVQLGSMTEIPWADKSFDLVFCLGTLEHTVAPFIALAEFNRVLAPDGRLFVDQPSVDKMEVVDPEYWYHKLVLFPIQMRDLLLKTGFAISVGDYWEKGADDGFYNSNPNARYICRKLRDLDFG